MTGPLRPVPAWAHGTGLINLSPGPTAVSSAVYQRIVDRLHRYCWGFDERRRDVLTDCFTEEVVWEASVMGETRIGPFRGRDSVVEWLTRYWSVQRDQRRHVVTNVVISQASADQITVLGYIILMGSRRAESAVEAAGVYQIACAREEEEWRIEHLVAGFDSPYWKKIEVSDMSEEARRLFGIRDK